MVSGSPQGPLPFRGQQVPGRLCPPHTAASSLGFPIAGPSRTERTRPRPASPSSWKPLGAPSMPPGLLQLCRTQTPPGVCPCGGEGLELSPPRELGTPIWEALLMSVSWGTWGCRAPRDARKPPGYECLHGCRCSAPRKVPSHTGVPGLGAADSSHAWATGCPPSGTLLPTSCTAPTCSSGAGCWSGAPG